MNDFIKNNKKKLIIIAGSLLVVIAIVIAVVIINQNSDNINSKDNNNKNASTNPTSSSTDNYTLNSDVENIDGTDTEISQNASQQATNSSTANNNGGNNGNQPTSKTSSVVQYVGEWKATPKAIETETGKIVDMTAIYGSSFTQYGGKLALNSDKTFSIWIGAGTGNANTHEGTYQVDEDHVYAKYKNGEYSTFSFVYNGSKLEKVIVPQGNYEVIFEK